MNQTVTRELRGTTLVDWSMLFETAAMREIVVKAHKADEGLRQNVEKLEQYLSGLLLNQQSSNSTSK